MTIWPVIKELTRASYPKAILKFKPPSCFDYKASSLEAIYVFDANLDLHALQILELSFHD